MINPTSRSRPYYFSGKASGVKLRSYVYSIFNHNLGNYVIHRFLQFETRITVMQLTKISCCIHREGIPLLHAVSMTTFARLEQVIYTLGLVGVSCKYHASHLLLL